MGSAWLAVIAFSQSASALIGGDRDPERFPDSTALQQAFEEAVSEQDQDRVDRLIRKNQNDLFEQLDRYAREWVEGQPEEQRKQALERARSLAQAAHNVFDGPALLEMVGTLQAFDGVQGASLLLAFELFSQAEAAKKSGALSQAINLFREADSQFSSLGWVWGVAKARLNISHVLFLQQEFEEALVPGRESCDLFERTGSPHHQDLAFDLVGWLLGRLGRFEECQVAFRRAVSFSKQVDPVDYAASLRNLGSVFCSWGLHEDAQEYLREWSVAARKANDPRSLGQALESLGQCYQHSGLADEAAMTFTERFESEPDTFRDDFERCFRENDERGIERLSGPGTIWWLFHKYACQFVCAQGPTDVRSSALDRLETIADVAARVYGADPWRQDVATLEQLDPAGKKAWRRAQALFGQGLHAYEQSEYLLGLDLLKEAEGLFEKVHWSMGLADVKHHLGGFYHVLGQFEPGSSCFNEAAELYDQLGAPNASAHTRTCLANHLISFGLYERALPVLESALSVKEQTGEVWGVAFCHREIGSCYHGLGQLDKSIAHLQQALDLWESIGEQREIAKCATLLGMAYNSAGRPEEAIVCLQDALNLQEKWSYPLYHAETLNHVGVALTALGRPTEAIERYQQALTLLETTEQGVFKAASLNGLGMSHYALHQVEEARAFHLRALELLEAVDQHRDAAWSLQNLARCELRLAHYGESLASLERCVQHLDRVGRRVLPEEGRNTFLSQWSALPALACDAAFELHEYGVSDAMALSDAREDRAVFPVRFVPRMVGGAGASSHDRPEGHAAPGRSSVLGRRRGVARDRHALGRHPLSGACGAAAQDPRGDQERRAAPARAR